VDDVNRSWARFRGKEDPLSKVDSQPDSGARTITSETFWALKNISFQVKQGEVLGIIGRNGAGKSTLLKILSRVTGPTAGEVRVKGRIASLLEVGTGFHPELSGRENIFLNGAILGMTKAEIRKKFDEIVAFSEVEQFIDTPVKRYSSGMYVRLAFAVAAHLEPEILIVDEVLAVGDLQFQKKCLGKMGNAAREGRTVLFVSHNMQAIRQLCHRAVLIKAAELYVDGPATAVIQQYFQDTFVTNTESDPQRVVESLPRDPAFRLKSFGIMQNGRWLERECVLSGLPLEVEMRYQVLEKTVGFRIFFDLNDMEGNRLFRSFHDEDRDGIPTVEPGHYVSRAVIPADLLAPRNYELRIFATVYNVRMCIDEPGVCIPLNVEATGRANRAYVGEPIRGKLAPVIPWVTSYQQ
jgi:lipopolysaccharide transport system ATP-binding protein